MKYIAPMVLPIIEQGKLKNILVSSRSEKQFGVQANGAPEGEYIRSLSIKGGKLSEKDALQDLDTGIYISSFHYLNWSDRQRARLTGMTRHDCMWVEKGKAVCPIEDLRWDESLYNIFGSNLLGLTKERMLYPNTYTYDERSTDGYLLPSILVSDFNCTL